MKALITGASSGIGKDIAIELSNLGYDLILVSKDLGKLTKVKEEIKTKARVIATDLSIKDNCIKLYTDLKNEDIDILVNNAGFGKFGEFNDIDLDKEIDMINVNLITPHVLTKLFLKDMIKKDSGSILNVASSAAFLPGPLMATYYATKSYLYKLSLAIYQELKVKKSNVKISVLCPGPVKTNFNNVADVSFSIKGLDSKYVAKYTIKKVFKNKLIIIPGFNIRLVVFLSKFIPIKLLLKINYNIQRRKGN
ncbi:MAG TPA: SDR family oxidoreductase [Bacilli bacterium]|nr:SDR family oxidoreductase [Bacilli bacterium]